MYAVMGLHMADNDYSAAGTSARPPLPFTGSSTDLVSTVTIYYDSGTLTVTAGEQQLRDLAAKCLATADSIAEARADAVMA